MRFYNREKELNVLERAFASSGADFVVISGRRRVGKTRLVEEFIKNKKAINVLIVPKEEKQVAKDLEGEIRNVLGYSPPFGSVTDALKYIFEQNVELVCFDEFSNVLQVNQAIPFELQKLWDQYREKKEVLLVVSGSYVGMMNKLFTAKKAPLFNRATHTLMLLPLPFRTVIRILNDLDVLAPAEQIGFFCVFGGVPYYYLLLEKRGNRELSAALDAFFFEEGAQLREEGENILRQEFGNAYAKYYALLEAIQGGFVSMNELSQKLGVRSTTLTKYMKALQHDFKLVERMVPFGENPARSKKGIYFICDNTLAFWFSLVYGKRAKPSEEELNIFLSRRFELLCKDFLVSFLEKRGERVLKQGKWWGVVKTKNGTFEQRELDLVIESDKAIYIGECKWTKEKIKQGELDFVKESAKGIKTKKPLKWVLFSKDGFHMPENEELFLFDPKRMIREVGA